MKIKKQYKINSNNLLIFIFSILISLIIHLLMINITNISVIFKNYKDVKLNNKDSVLPVFNDNINDTIIYKNNDIKLADILLKKINIQNLLDNNIKDNKYQYNISCINTNKETLNNSKIIDVPYINQDNYPTGCESVSTVMLLNYYNINITVDDFINKYLKKDILTSINGKVYAMSPNEAFIGNPYNNINSYGCYSNVIYEALNNIIKDYKLEDKYMVVNLSNNRKSLNELITNYIDNNIPVVIWGSINMKPIYNSKNWYLYNNDIYTWKANEHCLVLVGYDDVYYYFNDPYTREKITKYKKDIVEDRYNVLNRQAICILKYI